MKRPPFTRIIDSLRNANQWFLGTADRALEQAYDAALKIKAIEDEHFNGGKISPQGGRYSNNVSAYFQTELQKYLNIARLRLSEFRTSNSILNSVNSASTPIALSTDSVDGNGSSRTDKASIVLEKLKFIDDVLVRYARTNPTPNNSSSSLVVLPQEAQSSPKLSNNRPSATVSDFITDAETITDKTGVLPRSILSTINRIKKELDPKAEEDVVKDFRSSKTKTIISLRFVLFLILIPLLTQQISKSFVVGPAVDYFRNKTHAPIFINFELEESAFVELQKFEEKLKFEHLLNEKPELSHEDLEAKMRSKASEIATEYQKRSANAVKNVFSDLISLFAFAIVIVTNRTEIQVLKSFIDEIVYGLSDSAKAFIIILFTDVFVGFHSPHGWEVILEGLSRHLGIPENRNFIFLFIATFPVILDTIFKYWIFRYLNRISPSAVATYKNMNE